MPAAPPPVPTPWALTGNDNIATDGTNFLGTRNNAPLIFKTNANGGGGERMRITPDGNVGIGVTSPSAKLSAQSGNAIVISSEATALDAKAISGLASATGGNSYGVYGYSTSFQGAGVHGESAGGYGVSGFSAGGRGVHGKSAGGYGVSGFSSSGPGVIGNSTSSEGVRGESSLGIGVRGTSASYVGVRGDCSEGIGVRGTSMSSTGVRGDSSSGTGVSGSSTSGIGVSGGSKSGPGVRGGSESDTGVFGFSAESAGVSGVCGPGSGVFGSSSSGTGVFGDSSSGTGVFGSSDTSVGVFGLSPLGPAVYGYSPLGTGVYGTTGSQFGYAGYFSGDVAIIGNLSKAGGSFKIDHPLDPENKYLSHSFVESPDMMNIYNGNVALEADGTATVELPAWFEALNKDFRYQLTAIGAPGPNLYIAAKIKENRFTVAGGTPGMEVSWQVTGIRQDAYAEAHRIPVEQDKAEKERGKYLYPKEHGQPEERGVDYEQRRAAQAALNAHPRPEPPAKPVAPPKP
jgi:hypothetical protein